MSGPPEITLFFGRLHPLLVHLPIGFILLLGILEWLARSPRFRNARGSVGFILALAVPTALATALCGWLLSWAGGYEAGLLQWHKWTGIATAAVCSLAGLLYWLDLKKAYRWCLFAALPVLLLASHFGGSLTHGSDYLAYYAPGPLRPWLGGQTKSPPAQAKVTDPADLHALAGLIQPILQKHCVPCHGPEKSKADLRLDSFEALIKGSKSGPVIARGKSVESVMVKRLRLPLNDEDHMPPDGKPQPSPDDITLIQWWIDAGAPGDKKVGQLKPPANIMRILSARFAARALALRTVPPKPLPEVVPLAGQLTDELNIALTPLAPSEPWLQCNASIAGTNFGDAELARLAPLGANLRWLDLAGTRVTDAGLARIVAMPNLIRLHLERTAITDAGLTCVAKLANLEYLNLYGTPITDAGLQTLQKLPKLKQLYLWQTKVTPATATAFSEARMDKDQLHRWQDDIEQIKSRIREAQISVDLGTVIAAAPATNPAPINAQCPISGKPVDATKTLLHDGKLVAFCCDDCKAKFQQDPKPFVAKLALISKTTDSQTNTVK